MIESHLPLQQDNTPFCRRFCHNWPFYVLHILSLLVIVVATLLMAGTPKQATAATQVPKLTVRHPSAGIWVMYKGKNSVTDLQKPYIKGIMAYAPWNVTYVGENTFDWDTLDAELYFIINQVGKKAMVDVTAGYCPTLEWPQWMRNQVASKKQKNTFGCSPLQFWDPVYIDLHKAYIRAVAEHLAEFDANDDRPQVTDITFVRAEVMAETMENLPNDNELFHWTWQSFTPASNGRIYQVDLTKEINFNYQAEITLAYQRALETAYAKVGLTPPVAVAKGGNYWQPYPTRDQFVTQGVWLGQHSGAPNPQGWYYDIYNKVRSGETRGTSETGGKAPAALLTQYTYWEILASLHYGIEFIGIYGNNKFWPDLQPKGAVSYRENQEALEFGEQYAGHYRNPASSPGAWIAFRGSYPEDRFGEKIYARHMWTNYEFLLTQYRPQDSIFLFGVEQPRGGADMIAPMITRSLQNHLQDEMAACEKDFTPRECEYLWQQPDEYIGEKDGSHYYKYRTTDLGQVTFCGEKMFCTNPSKITRTEPMLWARRTNGVAGYPSMRFNLNDTFARSLGGSAKVRVVYLDQGHGRWELRYDSVFSSEKSAIIVQKSNSNHWQEIVIELPDVRFINRQEGGTDLTLYNMGDDDDIFHLIEVMRSEEPTLGPLLRDLYLPDVER